MNMKRIFLMLFMATAMYASVSAENRPIPMRVHESATKPVRPRAPLNLSIQVIFDSNTNMVTILCDNDNICGEVYIYDQSGELEAYSPYMNISIQLYSSGSHTIIIKGDGWVAEGVF